MEKAAKISRDERQKAISNVSGLNIAVNLFVASFKVVVGVLASSIAIISEGVNNATDALTSILTLVGSKLANKKRDKKHPFGYGRIEYLTSLIIGVFIIISGFEVLTDSIRRIFSPEVLNISYYSLLVVAVSALIKFALGTYTLKKGKEYGSDSLEALGTDCRNDSFVSLVTIGSALVFLVSGLSIDAYAGVFTSLMILKAGYEVLSSTVSQLLGQPAEYELASSLYREIRRTDGIINAVDMVLHNYGPDAYTGSVNVEIDHDKTVGEIYQFLHDLQIRIYAKYRVAMVFGIYAVDTDSPVTGKLHREAAAFVRKHEHVLSYHAIYLDPQAKRIYCDLVVDYDIDEYDPLKQEFTDYLKAIYPDQEIIVNIDTEFTENSK